MNKRVYVIAVFWILWLGMVFPVEGWAVGGIRGTIRNAKKEPLPFASIVVRNTSISTMSNAEAKYELPLKPGSYQIIFQYLGYQALTRVVEVGEGFTELDVELQEQAVTLDEFEVKAGNEDPAYTIMRKAIAKSKFHILQVQSYTARLYTKGSGRLTDSPFFLRNKLKKEGIDPNTVYFTESVADISFKQPNTFRQKVLSIRSNMEKFAPPNDYIQASFYEPLVAGAVSPLSPKAFAYYRFQYEGIFKDRGFDVNKIRVIPRSKGDNVFDGYLYIIEDLWSIHSLELNTTKRGFHFNVKQLYAPIEQVWMPVSHQIGVNGSMLGFAGEAKYMASVSNYALKVNPAFQEDVKVIDEKVEKVTRTAPAEGSRKDKEIASLEEAVAGKKELKRKDLNKLIRKYEKEEEQRRKNTPEDPQIVRNDSVVIDSLAYKRDSTFWNQVRTVPLTRLETESFRRRDSVMRAEEAKATKDTLKKNTSRFSPDHILFGHSYKLGKATRLEYTSPLYSLNFNTVEGWAFNTSLRFSYTLKEKHSVFIRPLARYSFAREKLLGTLRMGYRSDRMSVYAEGGQFVNQFNGNNPIPPLINTAYSLLFERNYMKLYEKNFFSLHYRQKISDGLSFRGSLEWAERRELTNNTTQTWIPYKDRAYTPNVPSNLEIQEVMPYPKALTLQMHLQYQPWLKYSIRNGKKRVITENSPLIGLDYRKGIANAAGSQVDYDLAELSFRHDFNIGVRGRLFYSATGGAFFNNRLLSFPDFAHFGGNRTIFQTGDGLTAFRLLDYYQFSTARSYWHAHLQYQFRKFLLTQVPLIRLSGLKEVIFLHYLHTDRSNNYWEAGYGINGIARLFQVEAVVNFQGSRYQSFGIRIGLPLGGFVSVEKPE